MPSETKANDWQDISTAPWNVDVLVYWPQHAIDDDECPTDEIVGGVKIVSRQQTGSSGMYGAWDEPEWISGHGLHLDDDWCWAAQPSHWQHLPPDPPLSARGDAQ